MSDVTQYDMYIHTYSIPYTSEYKQQIANANILSAIYSTSHNASNFILYTVAVCVHSYLPSTKASSFD